MTTYGVIVTIICTIIVLDLYRRNLVTEFHYYLTTHRKYKAKYRIKNRKTHYMNSKVYNILKCHSRNIVVCLGITVAVEILQIYILIAELIKVF